jgi:hypothetical protein
MKAAAGQPTLKLFALFMSLTLWLHGGVRKEVESHYLQEYENRAMFLKIPVRGQKQVVYVRDSGARLDNKTESLPLYFKVGDQVRITNLDFKGDLIRFKIASIDSGREADIEFHFPVGLRENFPQQAAFDEALGSTFTEGLTYTDIDSARKDFIKSQFDEFVDRLAGSSNTSGESVVEAFAGKIPAYQQLQEKAVQAQRELDQARNDLRQETNSRQQLQGELSRRTLELDQAREAVTELQAERDSLLEGTESLRVQTDQLQRNKQGYEEQLKHMANLGKQIEDLKRSATSLRKERAGISSQLGQANQRLTEIEREKEKLSQDLKRVQTEKDSLWDDVRTLTSNRKGLEARYIEIKRAKEVLERASDLSSALRLESRLETRDEETFRKSVPLR